MVDLGSVPQWITAAVAVGALGAAMASIKSQREIARKRAATDFFLKTEMDREMLASHKKYLAAVDKLKSLLAKRKTRLANRKTYEDFAKTDESVDMRDYMSIHELVAVGILNKVFDDKVCHAFWSGELERAYADTGPFLEYVQTLPGEKESYAEFVRLAKQWKARKQV
jgi:hypothetical protein